MASCSTTPFDGLGKRVNADRSHHRDAFAQQNTPQGLRHMNNADANSQFAQFAGGNQGASDFASMAAPYDFAAPQLHQGSATRSNGWANQFASEKPRFAAPEQYNQMFSGFQDHMQQQQQQQQQQHPAALHESNYSVPLNQLQPITPMLQPLRVSPTHAAMMHGQAGAATHMDASNEAFDSAFAAAEAHIKSLEINEEPAVCHPPPTSADQQNLRGVAATVLETVASASTDDPTIEKMKGSKFMALMESLKNETVKLGEDHESFVTRQGDVVSIEDLEETSSAIPRPLDGESGPQYVDRVYEQLRRQEGGPVLGAPRGQAPLEDPFEYIDRIKGEQPPIMNQHGSSDPAYSIPSNETAQPAEEEQKAPLPSPFEAANLYGPGGLSMADWEEHYDDAVWVPS